MGVDHLPESLGRAIEEMAGSELDGGLRTEHALGSGMPRRLFLAADASPGPSPPQVLK
jgi:hypothetical protein